MAPTNALRQPSGYWLAQWTPTKPGEWPYNCEHAHLTADEALACPGPDAPGPEPILPVRG